jgi:RNase H.
MKKNTEITNNQAEYMAIISALKNLLTLIMKLLFTVIQKSTVNQLNHEFAINNEKLRDLARESWVIIAKFSNLFIVWIPRKENLAGKMLGS